MKLFGYEIIIRKIKDIPISPRDKAIEAIKKYYNENKNYFNCGLINESAKRKIEMIKLARSAAGNDPMEGTLLLGLKEAKELVEGMFYNDMRILI